MKTRLLAIGLLSTILLTGCAHFTQQPAPVVTVGTHIPVTHGTHVVKTGETLYQIAWQYGRDYRDLAGANGIAAPYRIYPGQKLTLSKVKNKLKILPVKQSKVITQAATPIARSAPIKETVKVAFNNKWVWPAVGKVAKKFSLKGPHANKGIDITGALGSPVKASASGKVVYSGSGVRGYGQLIIIKHNDAFLSAYAHNHQLLVTEGQDITQGQVIAKMGHADHNSIKLHFEIRKNGQPVDPLSLLPS